MLKARYGPLGNCSVSNGFGLFDMHGLVWEWCLEAWSSETYQRRADGAVDPFVPGKKGLDVDPPRDSRRRLESALSFSERVLSIAVRREAARFGGRPDCLIGMSVIGLPRLSVPRSAGGDTASGAARVGGGKEGRRSHDGTSSRSEQKFSRCEVTRPRK